MHTIFCFTLTLNLSRIATAHWSGLGRLFLISFLSQRNYPLSEGEREREWHRKTTCAQGIYNSYMSWSISQAIFNLSSLHMYACMNEWKIFLYHTLTYIFNTFELFNSTVWFKTNRPNIILQHVKFLKTSQAAILLAKFLVHSLLLSSFFS